MGRPTREPHALAVWIQPADAARFDEPAWTQQVRQALPRGVEAVRVLKAERVARLAGGGVDVRALAVPRGAAAAVPPQDANTNGTEQALIEVWQELLRIQGVGKRDNFFELGGTSLMAMQAVVKVEQRIGKQISPRRYVIETLEQLAAAYDDVGRDGPPSSQEPQAATRGGVMQRLARLVKRA